MKAGGRKRKRRSKLQRPKRRRVRFVPKAKLRRKGAIEDEEVGKLDLSRRHESSSKANLALKMLSV